MRETIAGALPAALRRRFENLNPHHFAIAKGTSVVAIFLFISALMGALKEVAVAWRYGISETVDAYLFLFTINQWPVGIVAGVLGASLVPLVAQVRQESPQALPQFRAQLLGQVLVIAVLLSLLSWVSLPWLLSQPYFGFTTEVQTLAAGMVAPLSATLGLGIIAALLATWMMAGERHLNSLFQGAPALVILVSLLLFSEGPAPLIWGTVAGFALQVVLLWFPLRTRREAERPSLRFTSPYWKPLLAGAAVLFVGQAFMSLVNLADQFFAAGMGTGALSTLGYSNRMLNLVLGIGATAVGRATLPIFSRSEAETPELTIYLTLRWAALMLVVGLLVAGVTALLAADITELLFERGEFNAEDTAIVTAVFQYAMIQVPLYFCAMVMVSALLAKSKFSYVAAIGAILFFTKLLLAYQLAPVMELRGLMIATAGVYAVSCILCWLALLKTEYQRDDGTR